MNEANFMVDLTLKLLKIIVTCLRDNGDVRLYFYSIWHQVV